MRMTRSQRDSNAVKSLAVYSAGRRSTSRSHCTHAATQPTMRCSPHSVRPPPLSSRPAASASSSSRRTCPRPCCKTGRRGGAASQALPRTSASLKTALQLLPGPRLGRERTPTTPRRRWSIRGVSGCGAGCGKTGLAWEVFRRLRARRTTAMLRGTTTPRKRGWPRCDCTIAALYLLF